MDSWQAQKLLDDILEKSIEIVSDPIHDSNSNSAMDEGGIRLFKDAPIGIVFDHIGKYIFSNISFFFFTDNQNNFGAYTLISDTKSSENPTTPICIQFM